MSNSPSNDDPEQKAVPPSVDTRSPTTPDDDDDDETGSSDYDSESGSYSGDGSPPDLGRPKTPAHTLRDEEADDWTQAELDDMQTGMIAELSRLLSTADLTDPMLDQLNMAVVTPRAGSMGHHKTSTMDSIFSFMSNNSENSEAKESSMGFFAVDPTEPELDPQPDSNGIGTGGAMGSIGMVSGGAMGSVGKRESKLKAKSMGNVLRSGGASPGGGPNGTRGTDDYQNKSKLQVDKTIEKISSNVDEVISKLEKDKAVFGKKTKDKNGKKVLTKRNKEILDKLTKYQEALVEIHDSLEDFEKMIDDFEYDTVLHKQQFEYNIKKHYETKYETKDK